MKTSLFHLLVLIALTTAGCHSGPQEQSLKNYKYIATVHLTVAEGKRLIAKGISHNPQVRERLLNGIVIITRGTTNTYIAEELTGLATPHGAFVTGHIRPTGKPGISAGIQPQQEIILVKGVPVQMSYKEALAKLQPEDIVFKGGNMLNYRQQQIAVNVGAPDGGTVGRLRKYTDRGQGHWIVPIGLEKETSWDLEKCAAIAGSKAQKQETVLLNVRQGEIYTEIEAIQEFADVDIFPAAMGGVCGAEGGVSLMLCGTKAEVTKAVAVVNTVLGEPPFVE